MANRHKKFQKPAKYLGEGKSDRVEKEAMARKDGGKVCDMDGGKSAKRMDKRARGGGVGADGSPFSSAGGGGASKHPLSSAHIKG